MDYKELVKNLREEAVHQRVVFGTHGVSCQLEGAADAIETLLAERDALLTVSHGKCELCANFEKCQSDAKARVDCLANYCRNWQWRGPQKRDGHGDLPPRKGSPEMRALPLV